MTGRTHDLAGITTLILFASTQSVPQMTMGTALVAVGANTIGSLLPDIDDASAEFWDRIPVGSVWGKILSPLFGHHRMISHSLLGMAVAGWLVNYLLIWAKPFLVVNREVVWWALILGYGAHLVMDTLTKEGVPWLFPIPVRLGFPPFKFLRITTGKWAETVLIFPGLLILDGYLIWSNYGKWLEFIKILH